MGPSVREEWFLCEEEVDGGQHEVCVVAHVPPRRAPLLLDSASKSPKTTPSRIVPLLPMLLNGPLRLLFLTLPTAASSSARPPRARLDASPSRRPYTADRPLVDVSILYQAKNSERENEWEGTSERLAMSVARARTRRSGLDRLDWEGNGRHLRVKRSKQSTRLIHLRRRSKRRISGPCCRHRLAGLCTRSVRPPPRPSRTPPNGHED